MTATVSTASIAHRPLRSRYDRVAVLLHWTTAALVVVQFATSQVWGFLPRSERHPLIVGHMSFGIMLAAILVARIAWRVMPGHRVAPAVSGWAATASRLVHLTLYGLLVSQASLGLALRWSGGEAMSFFGLLIPSPIAAIPSSSHHLVGVAHERVGWAIVALASGHAVAALYHHYVLRDDVLRRMMPERSQG